MAKRLGIKLLFSLFLLFFLLPERAFAEKPLLQEKSRKVILIIVNRVTPDELLFSDHIKQLAKESSIGLLNTRTASSYDSASAYLSIGAGSRASAKSFRGIALNSSEFFQDEEVFASQAYFQRTHLKAPSQGVVNLQVAPISRENLENQMQASPGLLGDILKKHGLKVAVLGNADSLSNSKISYHREVALIGMDHTGRVFLGDVSKKFWLKDKTFPGSLRTNFKVLLSESKKMLKKADVIVIETGDTSRIENLRLTLWDQVLKSEKIQAILRIGQFVTDLLSTLNQKDTLVIILSPAPSQGALQRGSNLTPIILWGGSFSKSLLISETTKRLGLVSNVDVAPTILSFLGLDPPPFLIGYPLKAQERKGFFDEFLFLYKQIAFTEELRVPLLKGYIALVIITLILSTLLTIFPTPFFFSRISQLVILWILTFPLTFLLVTLFPTNSVWLFIFLILVISFLISCLAFLLKRKVIGPVTYISLLTSLALSIDIILGSPLMQKAIFGYSSTIGARYYGLGNEYMGALVGSSIVGSLGIFHLRGIKLSLAKRLIILLFPFLAILVGYPGFGANVGGTITVVATYFLTYLFLAGGGMKKRYFFYFILSLLVALFLLLVTSIIFMPSHVSKTTLLVKYQGSKVLLNLIYRKLAMNLKLLRWTAWSYILLTVIIIFPILMIRPVGLLEKVTSSYPLLIAGFKGIAFGSIVAFLFNDSGVIAAATMVIFAIVSLIYILLDERWKTLKGGET